MKKVKKKIEIWRNDSDDLFSDFLEKVSVIHKKILTLQKKTGNPQRPPPMALHPCSFDLIHLLNNTSSK